MARRKKPIIKQTGSHVPEILREVQSCLDAWRKVAPPEHGNVVVGEEDVLKLLLAGFFEPAARSLRTLEQLAQVDAVEAQLQVQGVPRSTLSDAMTRFRVQPLAVLIDELKKQLPLLGRQEPELERLTQRVLAGDGSLFRLAGDVAWALQRRKNKKHDIDSQVKLNLLIDVRRWTMEDFSVTGKSHKGGEAAAMQKMLRPGAIHLLDRAYYPYNFLSRLLQAGADMVVRLKVDIPFRAQAEKPLSDKDQQAGILKDETGLLGVADGKKGKAPAQTLRLVSVWDEDNQETVRLLTNLLDEPAWLIGYLYRCRWIIELFFRWLKVTAGMCHLLNTSPNGITLQFYVAMICALIIHIRTGMPVDKYNLLALGLVASGQCSFENQLPVLLKRQREKMLEKQRLARKKEMQKNSVALPG